MYLLLLSFPAIQSDNLSRTLLMVKISWSSQISLRFSEMPAPSTIPPIRFHFPEPGLTLTDRSPLKQFIASLFKKEGKKLAGLNYIFCSDDYLLDLNRQYLKHDYYTDIVTFDLSERGQAINAEIYISVERVRDNARQFGSTVKQEIHRVIFHGALHLCGYGDKKKADAVLMRKMEDKYLQLFFSPK
jgi:rRNA maturation RNase YbeY